MKNNTLFTMAIFTSLLFSCKSPDKNIVLDIDKATSTWDIYNDALLDIFDNTQPIEVLGEGYTWSEGPVWVPDEQMLLFSDVPNNKMYSWTTGRGVELFLNPSGYTGQKERRGGLGSNGLMLDASGRLFICQHGDRRISTWTGDYKNPTPDFETIASEYQGKRFNSPNDLDFSHNGFMVFTDPPYGLASDQDREISFHGVYLMDPEGQIHLLVDSLTRPNGVAFSPDNQFLYIANSDAQKSVWYRYDYQEETMSINKGIILYDVTSKVNAEAALPDGFVVHSSGIIFATGPGGIYIFDKDGRQQGFIALDRKAANCTFDEEEEYLYITAQDQLQRIKIGKV